jgi:septal ring factor EnvC (AmiA/AmiB activator)
MNIMTPIQIEKLKKEAARTNSTLQLEKKKVQAFKAKIQTLKEKNRQLQNQRASMAGKISRSKQQNVRLKQHLHAALKKNHPLESYLNNLFQDINIQT